MTSEEALLEEIAKIECLKEDRLTRFLGYKIHIIPTHQLKESIVIPNNIIEKSFKPSIYYRIVMFSIFSIFSLGLGYAIFKNWRQQSDTEKIVGLIFSAIFLCFSINRFIVSKKLNYNIKLNMSGIFIAGKSFCWSEISSTAIMKKPNGNISYTNFLVVVLKDMNTYESFQLDNFISSSVVSDFSIKLSAYTEYFKSKAT